MPTYNIPVEATQEHVAAVVFLAEKENQEIQEENARRATENPPLDPLPLYSSPIDFISKTVERGLDAWQDKHARLSRVEVGLQQLWANASDAQRAAAVAALES
jgi:hypothetical protein